MSRGDLVLGWQSDYDDMIAIAGSLIERIRAGEREREDPHLLFALTLGRELKARLETGREALTAKPPRVRS